MSPLSLNVHRKSAHLPFVRFSHQTENAHICMGTRRSTNCAASKENILFLRVIERLLYNGSGDLLEQELEAGTGLIARPCRLPSHQNVRKHVRQVTVQQPLGRVLPADICHLQYARWVNDVLRTAEDRERQSRSLPSQYRVTNICFLAKRESLTSSSVENQRLCEYLCECQLQDTCLVFW